LHTPTISTITSGTGSVPVGDRDESDEEGQDPPGCYLATIALVLFQRYLISTQRGERKTVVVLLETKVLNARSAQQAASARGLGIDV